MANITIFDETSGNTRTIAATLEQAVLANQDNGAIDYFLKFATGASTLAGVTVSTLTMTGQDDLVLGTTQYDEVTATDYANISDAVDDYVLRMVKGDPSDAQTAMSFA